MNVLDLGVELEFGILFALAAVAGSVFDKFEVETPAWRKLLRWIFAAALTFGAVYREHSRLHSRLVVRQEQNPCAYGATAAQIL